MMTQRSKRRERSWSQSETQPPLPHHDPDMPSSSSSASSSLIYLPGLRFVPTDEELIYYYMEPFSRNSKISWPNLPIHHVNIYESNPQQLSGKYKKSNLKEWFFISERTKIKKDGKKQKRGDNGGYWHATSAAKKINAGEGVVGYRTTLSYYAGKQSNGAKTNWLMQEYWVESSDGNKTVDHALCKIYLSPMAKNKNKVEDVEALEDEFVFVQPRNVDNQQPQTQQQFCPPPAPLVLHQHQPRDVSDSQPPQIWPAEPDSYQPQRHNIAYREPHQSEPLNTINHQRSHLLQYWQFTQDSHQTQPHDNAYHQPHQPQSLRTFPHQFSQFWPAPLDSHQSHCYGIRYHEPQSLEYQHQYQSQFGSAPMNLCHPLQQQFCPNPLDSYQPQLHHQNSYNFDGNFNDTVNANLSNSCTK